MSNSEYETSGGIELTNELIEHLSEEAEQGYDAEQLRPRSRRGRPPIGSEAATLFQVRLEPELRSALAHAAQLHHSSPSEMARQALRMYLDETGVSGGVAGQSRPATWPEVDSRTRPVDARGRHAVSKVGLADQQVLLRWADSIGARSEFPRLIRRLILETGGGVVHLGFPAGEGVAVGGWDGSVRATESTPLIPKGLSLWELSVEKSVGTKADKDYSKRLTTGDGSPTASCTYVAASLRRWSDRSAWARDRSAEGRWAEVRAYGVDDIETWLETAPVTHAWISEELGLGPYGLRAAESWWGSWSSACIPHLPPSLVLAGRESFVEALQKRLEGPPQLTTVKARSVDDVLAAVAAVGTQAAASGDPRLLARTAFVDNVQTWRSLLGHPGQLLLVAGTQKVIAEANAMSVNHVIVPVVTGIDADIELPAIDSNDAAAALKTAGIENDQRADELGRLARRSLVALTRSIANKPELHVPGWARPPVSRQLRAALLACRWQEETDGDRSVLEALSGATYEELRDKLTAFAAQEDPFVGSVGRSWALVSSYDAWMLLASCLSPDDLTRLDGVVQHVLGELDPAFDLPEDERWHAPVVWKIFSHSKDLRRGLAETLALLGLHGEKADLGGNSESAWASHIVSKLLKAANEDATCRLWASIADLLPLLTEAAPDVFLDAVRQGVIGEHPVLANMFTDREGRETFGRHSPHTGLLWALESTVWPKEYFGQTLDLLARLAEIDPGGRLSNRPFESLTTIYWPLRPATSADIAARLAVLDGLRQRHKEVAWRLMLSIIPGPRRILMPAHEPQFRNWKPSRSSVMIAEVVEFISEIVARLLHDVATTDEWVDLLDILSYLPPADRELVRQTFLARLDDGALRSLDLSRLWETIRSLIGRHRQYASTDWAMPEDELQLLDVLEQRLRPTQPAARSAWLFAEYMPDLGELSPSENLHRYETELATRRRDAMDDILATGGLGDARRIAKSSPTPWSIGFAIADATTNKHEDELLALLTADVNADVQVAAAYVGRRFGRDGWTWVEHLINGEPPLSTSHKARLLLATRDYPTAWESADRLGSSVTSEFWERFDPHGLGGDFPYVAVVAQRLLGVGRYGAALRLLRIYARRESSTQSAELVIQALDAILSSETPDPELAGLRQWDFEIMFQLLERHIAELDWKQVARLQWSFLPILGFEPKALLLHELLTTDPSFFVDVLSKVYRAKGAVAGEEESPEAIRIATNGYRLLSSWTTVPGVNEDGALDEQVLHSWISEALIKLDEVNRRDVGEIHIGHVLARVPADNDGRWPTLAVCEIFEEMQSERVERGFIEGALNSRGMTTRSPEEGGIQERELAAKYSRQADDFTNRWPRTAGLLRKIAKSYDSEARREEGSAERIRSGYER